MMRTINPVIQSTFTLKQQTYPIYTADSISFSNLAHIFNFAPKPSIAYKWYTYFEKQRL